MLSSKREWNCWKQQLTDHWKAPPLPLCIYWDFQCLPAAIGNSPLLNYEAKGKSLRPTFCRDYWLPALPATVVCLYEIFQDSQTLIFPKLQPLQQLLQTQNQAQEDTNTVIGKSSRKYKYLEPHQTVCTLWHTPCGWMSSVPTSELSIPFLGQKSDCWSSKKQISEEEREEKRPRSTGSVIAAVAQMPGKASPLYILGRQKAQQSTTEPQALFHHFTPLLMLSESSAKLHATNNSLVANDGVVLSVFIPCCPIVVQQKFLLEVTWGSQESGVLWPFTEVLAKLINFSGGAVIWSWMEMKRRSCV